MTRRYDENSAVGGHVRELLSAYIDNQLETAQYESVRRHLKLCPDCRADYVELSATRRILQSMPAVSPPRAFTLTEQMAREIRPQRVSWLVRLLSPVNASRYATGSVLSFALLALLLVGGLFGSRVNSTFSRIGSGLSGNDSAAPVIARSAPVTPGALSKSTEPTNAAASVFAEPTGTPFPAGIQALGETPAANAEAGATSVVGAAPAPQGTVAPAAASATEPPVVASGDTQSTSAPPAASGESNSAGTGAADTAQSPPPAGRTTSQENHNTGPAISPVPALEIGLLVLGLLFGLGALISRRAT